MQSFILSCKKNFLYFTILILFSNPLFSTEIQTNDGHFGQPIDSPVFSVSKNNKPRIKTSFEGNNIINIQTGNVFSFFSNIQIKDKGGLSFSAGTLNSSIKDCSFNSYLISTNFFFPINRITIKNTFDFYIINDLFFNDNINFNQLLLSLDTINALINFTSFSIGTSISAGAITTDNANIYILKLSPRIPFLSFSISIKSFLGKILFQYGMFDINIKSNQLTINSSSFQSDFLFLYQKKILFDKTNLFFWGGGILTQGNAFAKTESLITKINFNASDIFFIIGTGIKFKTSGTLFYLKSNLDFLYILISNAKSDINMKILGIHNKYNFVFKENFNYALLLPSIETGIKFNNHGKFFIKKNLPIPISFNKSSTPQLDSSQKINYSFINILLSGLSVGIEL